VATLYLVATPIGNLGDITLRAIETLQQVDVIASEDTRKTGRLLEHLRRGGWHDDRPRPQIAFHEHNEARAGARLMDVLREGRDVALVTNAGTPGIADPGYSLVQRALEEAAAGADIHVTMVPGPSALIMALVLSGLPAHSFCFRGFPPRKPGRRRSFFAADAALPHTLIYYESPHRLVASLADARDVFGNRPAALANDLTKLYEQVLRGSLDEIIAQVAAGKVLGEYILVVHGAEAEPDPGREALEDEAP
jgi:16S rRNA (cytidine1402-2'-O)-methyltransferase